MRRHKLQRVQLNYSGWDVKAGQVAVSRQAREHRGQLSQSPWTRSLWNACPQTQVSDPEESAFHSNFKFLGV